MQCYIFTYSTCFATIEQLFDNIVRNNVRFIYNQFHMLVSCKSPIYFMPSEMSELKCLKCIEMALRDYILAPQMPHSKIQN
jgi:hypothetical protein